MARIMVAGNWKMNANTQFTQVLLSELTTGVKDWPQDVQMVVFPPFPYLAQAQGLLQGTPIALGAQNVSEHDKGAYTGEVSVQMLQDMDAKYVLVGHSERRAYYGETDAIVAAKCKAVLATEITPILCIGETLEQRQAGDTVAVVTGQIQEVIDTLGVDVLGQIIIAYEPIWAIGTGLTALPEQAQTVHQAIRTYIAKYNQQAATDLDILYGGSVSAETAGDLFAQTDIDGGLVGGASLTSTAFLAIGQSIV